LIITKKETGAAKVFACNMTKLYREAYGIFAVNGILFNHESERRGETFVTRKITRGIARIKAGLDKKLYLGNLDAKRDWGYAPEFCEAMWLMMQKSKPDDYVIGTGETHTVKEFVELAFKEAGLGNWKKYVEIDRQYYRPAEVNVLVADTRKAERILKWQPKTKFKDLVKIMVWNDINNLKTEIEK
jgi:GDPmannose 4,6-dehydratase